MALDKKQLLSLMKAVANAQNTSSYTYSFEGQNFGYADLCDTLRVELKDLAGTYQSYRRNQVQLFELIEETLDDILPKKVMQQYGQFAEVRTFGQGEKPIFTRKTGHQRAKQFITKVGLAGRYEVFKLGGGSFEVPTSAIGGAAQIGLEEFLDGRVDFSEVLQIVMEGMDELVYREIARAMNAAVAQLPAANKVAVAGFDEAGFDRLIAVASAYGLPTIYCTYEFAVKMAPAANWVSDEMKNEKWAKGYFANYKGNRVIILPQSFEDETNAVKTIDPGYCWIIPSGTDGKPAKVAFEGSSIVSEFTGADQSRDVQVYKKVGVNVLMTNNICSYIDTELQGSLDTLSMFGFDNTNGELEVTVAENVHTLHGTLMESDHATYDALDYVLEDVVALADAATIEEINPALALTPTATGVSETDGVWVKTTTIAAATSTDLDYKVLVGEGEASAVIKVTVDGGAQPDVVTYYIVNSDITFV